MKRFKFSVVLLAILLAAMAMVPCVSAYQASDYDMTGVSTPTATTAKNYQIQMGYSAEDYTDAWTVDALNRLDNDAIFFFNGHGITESGVNGGGIVFQSGRLLAQNPDITADKALSSKTSAQIGDTTLAVYVACYTAATSANHGNLVTMSRSKGMDNVIGFSGSVGLDKTNYWADKFWERTNNGESIGDAANNARNDAFWFAWPYMGNDGIDTIVVQGDNPYGTYL